MDKGETANLGPSSRESVSGPRFSIIDMGAMVGPERMDTSAMLKSELASVYEDNSLVRAVSRAVASPGDAVIDLLKPLIVLVALVVGFIGAALIMESHAGASIKAETPVAVTQPQPELPPEAESTAVTALEDDAPIGEFIDEAYAEEEETEPEEAVAAAEPARDEARRAHKPKRGKKNKKRRNKRSKKRRHKRRR